MVRFFVSRVRGYFGVWVRGYFICIVLDIEGGLVKFEFFNEIGFDGFCGIFKDVVVLI